MSWPVTPWTGQHRNSSVHERLQTECTRWDCHFFLRESPSSGSTLDSYMVKARLCHRSRKSWGSAGSFMAGRRFLHVSWLLRLPSTSEIVLGLLYKFFYSQKLSFLPPRSPSYSQSFTVKQRKKTVALATSLRASARFQIPCKQGNVIDGSTIYLQK